MMARYSFFSALCAVALVAVSANAQSRPDGVDSPANPSVNPLFSEIDKINADSALIKAKLDNARLRKELTELESGRPSTSSAPMPQTFPGPMGLPQGAQQFSNATPASAVVLLVTSSPRVNKGLPTALIRLPNGSNVSGTSGTKIPGVGTLRDVSVSQVTVQDGKGVSVIPFDSGSATSSGGR